MRVVGRLDDGSPHLGSGAEFPANPLIGEIFEKTGDSHGPYYWSCAAWVLILTNSVAAELGYTPVNKAGDSLTGSLSLPKTLDEGLKVDGAFAWRSVPGILVPRTSTEAPTVDVFIGNIKAAAYNAADAGEVGFTLPYDYLPGSHLFLNVLWSHNSTALSGTFALDFYATYAKGHNQTVFPTQKVPQLSVASLTISNTPQYAYRTDEVQISVTSGSATQFDSSLLEVNGHLLLNYVVNTIPSMSGSAYSNAPYLLGIDLLYQSRGVGTKNRTPGFYA